MYFIFSVRGQEEAQGKTAWCVVLHKACEKKKKSVVYDCKSSLLIPNVLDTVSKTNFCQLQSMKFCGAELRVDNDIFWFMRATVLPHTYLFTHTFTIIPVVHVLLLSYALWMLINMMSLPEVCVCVGRVYFEGPIKLSL